MYLLLTIEGQNCTENGLAQLLSDTKDRLEFITAKDAGLEDLENYGTEFRSIAIIPTCVDDNFWETLGWKERKWVSRKKKEADVRLRMDYNRFMNETVENKRLLFVDIIIKSIRIVQSAARGDFEGERLIEDILRILDITPEQLTALNNA